MKKLLLTIGICLCTVGMAVGQTTLYSDNFTGEDGKGQIGSTSDLTGVDWTIDASAGSFTATSDFFAVQSGVFEAQDVDGDVIWTSESINISGFTSLSFSIDMGASGDFEASGDVFKVEIIIDSGSADSLIEAKVDEAVTGDPMFVGSTQLSSTLQTFTNTSIGTGSSAVIRITANNNAGSELYRFDNLSLTGTSSGGAATKLTITDVNSSDDPVEGETFSVTVQSQDNSDLPANVSQDTTVTLSVTGGSGTLSGTLSGTISSGSNFITFSGLSYDVAETFTLNATNTGGSLTSDTESVTVIPDADQLVIKDFPSSGFTNTVVSSFTVEAQRSSDNSVDDTYTENITIAKVSGSGTLGGTVTKAAVAGVATFDDITFSADDTYTINAGDGTLTSATSSSITITTAVAPTAGSVFITEVSDAASDFNAEFIELYNNSSSDVTLASTSLIRYAPDGTGSAETTFSISSGTGSSIIPANGFLIIARDATEAEFETEWGTLESNTNYNEGSTSLFFGNGRRWVVKESSTVIDSTTISVANGTRHFQAPVGSQTFIEGVRADATPGKLDGAVDISGTAGWRMLSFPVENGSADDISDDTAIQGVTGGDNTGETSNFLTYDNSGAFETPTNVSTSIGNGYGFITYFYNNTTGGSSELPLTLDVSGTEPSSNVSVTLNTSTTVTSSYYTMVGNPFASNYDLDDITVTGGTISSNVTFWNNGSSSYSVQDRTTPYIVEPWQGFWVESTDAATSITIPTSGKTTSAATGTFFSKKNADRGDLNFTLTSENTYDEAIRLSVRPNATLGYDVDDASKFTPLTSPYATMAFIGSLNDEDKLQSVFSIPSDLKEEITIPLDLEVYNTSGELTFAWNNIETMPEGWDFELVDYETGTTVLLNEESSYVFDVEAATSKQNRTVLNVATTMESSGETSRFGLRVVPSTSVSTEPTDKPITFGLEQNYPNPFNPSTTIKYSVGEAGPVSITVYNVMGQKVAELVNTTHNAGDNFQVTWNAAGNASGIYYYRLAAPGQVITRQMTLIK